MTTPHDPRQHPLQDDEVELARVLRALPAAEPSSKLDAAILGAAADAVATAGSPRPRRRVKAERWLPTWAIGTAAAAVLAIGVGTQLLPPPTRLQESAAPAAQTAPRPAAPDRLDVDLIERKREYPPTYPPPAAEQAKAKPGSDQPAPPPSPPPPPAPVPEPVAPIVESAPAAFPEAAPAAEAGAFAPPPQHTALDTVEVTGSRLKQNEPAPLGRLRQSPAELNRLDAERRTQARQMEQLREARAEASREDAGGLGYATAQAESEPSAAHEEFSPPVEADDAQAASAPLADAPAPPAPPAQGPVLAAQALPPVTSDSTLAPPAWIERIRDRVRSGDREGALASLRSLRAHHPDVAIPADLQALR